jgi:signal transduction histidine kinase
MSAHPPADPEQDLQRLRHDLANPLSALLAEVQLLLLDANRLTPDVVTALRGIEAMAVRMRTILRS